MKRSIVAAALIAGLAAVIACRGGDVMADRALINGKIWTGDPSRPWAEAAALRDDRILEVGTSAEIRRRIDGAATETIDLRGNLVLPGFIDSHVHFLNGGASLLSLPLRDAGSKEEFVRRVAEAARTLPKGEWILNGDWDHQSFDPVELPRRDWIDAVTPDHPVCVSRLDGHMVLANSLALKMAGVTRLTATPPGGEIVRDPATGEPTGILKDAAMDLVDSVIPEPTGAQKLRAAEAALKEAAEKGVTSVHDVSAETGFDVYQELRREGRLTTRIYGYVPAASTEAVLSLGFRTGFGDPMIRFAGLKAFADGSLGSQTAYFDEPYSDDPSTAGLLAAEMFPEGTLEERILAADRAGLQTAVHAIGDRANALILDIYERVLEKNGPRDRRLRIEHAQHLRPGDFARFARLGVIASVQPYHAIDDGRWAEAKIGPGRARTTYAFRSFLEAGAVLAFGSDWPVAPMNPILGIHAAVTRATIDGRRPGGWVPEQKLSVEEAVRAFTAGGAFAEFAEADKGVLSPGRLADFVVLDTDIFQVAPEMIREAKVLLTICGGRVVHRDDAWR